MAAAKKKPAAKKPPVDQPEQKPVDATPDKPVDTGERKPLESLTDIKEELQTPPEQPKKRGPGRPKGSGKKKPEPEPELPSFDVDVEMMKRGIKTIFELLAQKRGLHWRIDDSESQTLATVYDALINKYLPRLGPYMVEINALAATVMILGPRMYVELELIKLRKLQAQQPPQPSTPESKDGSTSK